MPYLTELEFILGLNQRQNKKGYKKVYKNYIFFFAFLCLPAQHKKIWKDMLVPIVNISEILIGTSSCNFSKVILGRVNHISVHTCFTSLISSIKYVVLKSRVISCTVLILPSFVIFLVFCCLSYRVHFNYLLQIEKVVLDVSFLTLTMTIY